MENVGNFIVAVVNLLLSAGNVHFKNYTIAVLCFGAFIIGMFNAVN